MEKFLVPFDFGEDVLIEKKSRFIGRVWNVTTEDEAKKLIEQTRKENREAVHNVFAYIIKEGNITRFSDDGEPQGTAGMPVLEVIRREGLTNVLCIVTRYFGGILLGAGGLVRAYNSTAKLAVDAAGIAEMRSFAIIEIDIDYHFHNIVLNIIPNFTCDILDTQFTDKVKIIAQIIEGEETSFNEKLRELSSGQIIAKVKEYKFLPFKLN